MPGQSHLTGTIEQLTDKDLSRVLKSWDVPLGRVCREIPLPGSPERTELRTAVEDTKGRRFVLERIHKRRCDHRRRIAGALLALAQDRMKTIHPYLRTRREATIAEIDGAFWQLIPFIEGVPLPRPEYVNDAWRGVSAARFLAALAAASASRRRSDSAAFPLSITSRDCASVSALNCRAYPGHLPR